MDYPVETFSARNAPSSSHTSRTSTARSSRSSACRRPSRARCSRATRATRARCGGSTSTSSPADAEAAPPRPSTATRATARASSTSDLPRLRRRLGRPARRRPRGSRMGVERDDEGAPARPARLLPRAVDALHPLRRPDGRRPWLPLLARRVARARVPGGDGLPLRHLLAPAARRSRSGPPSSSPAPTTPRPRHTRARSGRRRSTCCAACCPPPRSRTWASSPAARPTSR